MDTALPPTYIRTVDGFPGEILKAARKARGWSQEKAQDGLGFPLVQTGIQQIARWENADAGFKPRSPRYWAYVKKLGLLEPAADGGFMAVAKELARLRTDLDRLLIGLLGNERQRAEAGVEDALIQAIRRLAEGNGGDQAAEA